MLANCSPIVQTLLGTGLTWAVTAFGALFCALSNSSMSVVQQRLLLDVSLGFSAGVMLAASFWSLLEPAISMAADDLELGGWSVLPPVVGIILGVLFVSLADRLVPVQWFEVPEVEKSPDAFSDSPITDFAQTASSDGVRRRTNQMVFNEFSPSPSDPSHSAISTPRQHMTRRLWLLLLAVTVHNIPEGLAVGIAFGGIGAYSKATIQSARNLAIGIAIQNFPEGLAVSLPLHAAGYGFWKSFWYGQLSGFVEPLAGLLGCLAVQTVRQLQPYALGFAAGAMIFVAIDDVIPEAQAKGNGRLASFSCLLGFILLMILEVVLAPV